MWYEIFTFELRYRARRLDTYIYFLAIFLFSLVGVDFVFGESDLGQVKENSPFVISYTMAALSAIFMMISSMIMGVSILRDYAYNMEPILFVHPIQKWEYLLGRFLGSFLVLVLVFSGIIWGMILGECLPWREADTLLPFHFGDYIQSFFSIVFPALFFGGAIFFVSGALSRNLIVVYTQGILFFLVLMLTRSIENEFISALLDPFGISTLNAMVEFWTPHQKNLQGIPFEGVLLYNRLAWVAIGIGALAIGYSYFSFSMLKGKRDRKTLKSEQGETPPKEFGIKIPAFTLRSGMAAEAIQLFHHTSFYLKSILKENSFWALLICGMVIILINGIQLGTVHGVNSYPTTYLIVEELQEMSILFFLILLVFYSGELIWKERELKVAPIFDVLPISDSIAISSKYLALLGTYTLLMCALLFAGICFQTFMGFYQYELGVYFKGFFLEIFPFLALFTFASFFFHVLINYKFLGYLALLFFFILTEAMGILGYDHGLYNFGAENLGTYSDMNGYGHFLRPYIWFKIYWLAFCLVLFIGVIIFSVRGNETQFSIRWELAKQRLSKSLTRAVIVALVVFASVGVYIFYHTNILNEYWSNEEQDTYRVNYEKILKEKEYLPQPKIRDIHIAVDLFPSERSYVAEGYYILKNEGIHPLREIHVQQRLDAHIDIEYVRFEGGASVNKEHEPYGYFVYTLDQALQVGDSLKMEFKQTYKTQGFREKHSDTELVYNGTFFNNNDFPSFGYNNVYELRDNEERAAYGLSPRKHRPSIDDKQEIRNARNGDDGYEINFEMLISTDSSQTAVVPGKLENVWNSGDRSYFHYKMGQEMIHFYPMVSARYEVMRDKWKSQDASKETAVDLEIYYHKGHEYNLDRMMRAMKASLSYFSQEFSHYPYEQLRIMEVPRYIQRAQSFPNTIPFSEAIGFVMEVDEEKDVDMPFFITAHEVAHQWWGLQVVAANVQGRSMILESLAQYSALMVLKHHFPEEKVQQLLDMERKKYFEERTKEADRELPLSLVENQQYIYYRKGAVNLYALQDYISEDSVNIALRRFIRDWNAFGARIHPERYATTADLLSYFREVTPDSLQYVIGDLFERITFYENKITEGNYQKLAEDHYQVNLSLLTKKLQVDSLGKESYVAMKDWIELGIYGKSGEVLYLQKHKIQDTLTQVHIRLHKEPYTVEIDPQHILLEKDVKDNVKILDKAEDS